MWKKDESAPAPAPNAYHPPATPSAPAPARGYAETREAAPPATIGASIALRGDLTGEEDLLVAGRVEGTITLPKNTVVIGKTGQVKADVRAKSVRVEGEVIGNLFGEEDVVISASGRVQGNVTSPRVTLENGSRFKGSIDMEAKGETKTARDERREEKRQGEQRPVDRSLEVARA